VKFFLSICRPALLIEKGGDLTGYAGILKGTQNSSSALLSFTINARLESGVPLREEPAGCQRSLNTIVYIEADFVSPRGILSTRSVSTGGFFTCSASRLRMILTPFFPRIE
jgi:hypothetical protein